MPCKKLDRAVFRDNEIAGYIKGNFVAVKINGKVGTGAELKKKYEVIGYPSVVFLDDHGREIDRIVGWSGDRDGYFQTIKDYRHNRNSLAAYLKEYKNNPDDVTAANHVAMKYLDRYERDKAQPYFKKVLELDAQDAQGFAQTARCNLAMYEVGANDNPAPLLQFIKNCNDRGLLTDSYNTLLRYYRSQKDVKTLLATYEQAIARIPDNTSWLNGCAWTIYEQKLADRYEQGIKMARKALELEPQAAHIWDTLAWLQFASGNTSGAVHAMEKALQLEPDTREFKEALEKFKQPRT